MPRVPKEGKRTGALRAVMPAPRLAALFAAGAAWFFLMPWGGQLCLWMGIAYNAILLAAALVDYRWLQDSRACSVGRSCEAVLSIGERNPVWLDVSHRGTLPLRVAIRDEPPLEFETAPRVVAVDVAPGGDERVGYHTRPHERGDYRFGDIHARFSTRLGLLARQACVPAELAVRVYPDVLQARKHLLLSRENRVALMGVRRSRMHGQGQEFERLRDYIPDDSLRHVDWKATARRRVLTTREYDVERCQSIFLLLDLGRTMASRTVEESGELGLTKADCAINACVLLAHVAAQAGDRVGLFCFASGPIAFVPPGKGQPQAGRLVEALYALKPRIEEAAYYDNLLLAGRKQRKRSLVFLFTDLIDPDSSRRVIDSIPLLTRKHLVVCVALADYELPSLVNARPAKPPELYTQAVALGILRERRKALALLARQGALVIDATPADLSVAAVNKYLQLKREARV